MQTASRSGEVTLFVCTKNHDAMQIPNSAKTVSLDEIQPPSNHQKDRENEKNHDVLGHETGGFYLETPSPRLVWPGLCVV